MENDILEGLKNALVKGNTLKQAMMSFYNAGYKKEEIEEAARALYPPQLSPPPSSQPSQKPSVPQKPIKQAEKQTNINVYQEEKVPSTAIQTSEDRQLISKYESKTSPKGKLTLVLLLMSLIAFILVVIGVFMFYSELIDFFKSLF